MKLTDLNSPDTEKAAVRVLFAVADHLNTIESAAVLEAHSLLVCISAEAYKLADRRVDGEGMAASRAAMALSPEREAGVTRGAYARLIWAQLEEAGHEPDDSDAPVTRGHLVADGV
ncbi:hypothetical protein ACFY0G_17475 [Streptomyces sp. NPDC001552]|uniref:hypothetical protein n=1 Tax=Streptomyces sp. NPDC001552 TaxID=3364587 RepID=UPI0036CC5732